MSETRDIVEMLNARREKFRCQDVRFTHNEVTGIAAEITHLRTESATLKAECGAARSFILNPQSRTNARAYQAARTATNQLCPEWAKENP